MAEQQIYTRGVRRSAAPTVRLVLPTTRSAAVANDLLQNLIIDRSAPPQPQQPRQPRPVQQMPSRPPAARPPQFAQRSTPQRAPQSLRLEGQGVLDQVRNLLIRQRGWSPDAADAALANEQGGQAGRDAAGSMMGRTVNEGTAVGKYGTAAARTLGNIALSATLGPIGPAAFGFATRNLTNDDPNAVAADGITTGVRTAVTNAVPGLGLARTLMGMFRLPDPVVQVEQAVRPVVKDVLDQLTNPPALPAAGEGAISPGNPSGGSFGRNSNNSDDSNANSPWGGAIIGSDPAADRADADAENSPFGGLSFVAALGRYAAALHARRSGGSDDSNANSPWGGAIIGSDPAADRADADAESGSYGGRNTGGSQGQGGSAGSTGGSGRGIGGSGFGGGNGGSTGGLGGV